jgi:hypothetical protein
MSANYELVSSIKAKLNAKGTRNKGFTACDCPFGCGHTYKDSRAGITDDGVFICHSTQHGEIKKSPYDLADHLGINYQKSEPVKTEYVYTDENNQPLIKVTRTDAGNGKTFFQSKYNGTRFIKGISGARRVLYRLPELIKAQTVFITEGEKAADFLQEKLSDRQGYAVTTNISGAGKWQAEYSKYLTGKTVYILPDNDKPGEAHASQVLSNTANIASSCKIVNLPDFNFSRMAVRLKNYLIYAKKNQSRRRSLSHCQTFLKCQFSRK